jgi:hypothetical protein
MERLHAPNEFFRIRTLREGRRAWEELWRLPGGHPAVDISSYNPARACATSAKQPSAQIKDEYEAWAKRRLHGIVLDYLLVDASFFRMHPDPRM